MFELIMWLLFIPLTILTTALIPNVIIFIGLSIIGMVLLSNGVFHEPISIILASEMLASVFIFCALTLGERHLVPNCRIATYNTLWGEMKCRWSIFHNDALRILERIFYRLFPTFNDVSSCWHEYLLIKNSLIEYKDILNSMQKDIFILLHQKDAVHKELYEYKSSYSDVIYKIIADLIEEKMLYYKNLDSLSRSFNVHEINTTKELFIKCINNLYKSGAFTEEQYKENIEWINSV